MAGKRTDLDASSLGRRNGNGRRSQQGRTQRQSKFLHDISLLMVSDLRRACQTSAGPSPVGAADETHALKPRFLLRKIRT
jgi:hypothetical protein